MAVTVRAYFRDFLNRNPLIVNLEDKQSEEVPDIEISENAATNGQELHQQVVVPMTAGVFSDTIGPIDHDGILVASGTSIEKLTLALDDWIRSERERNRKLKARIALLEQRKR